jgi:hypothetical protein
MRRKRDDFYVDEIAHILGCTVDDAKRICRDQEDGAIDLGICLHRHEELKRQRLLNDDPGYIPVELMTRSELVARYLELIGEKIE